MTRSRFIQAALASLCLHFLFLGWLASSQERKLSAQKKNPFDRAMKVESLSPEQIRKYRTLGVRGGKKKGNLIPIVISSAKNKKKIKSKTLKNSEGNPQGPLQNKKDISLRNLSAPLDYEKIINQKEKVKIGDKNKDFSKENSTLTIDQRKAIIKKEIIAAENGLPLTSLRSSQTVNNFRRQARLRNGLLKEMGTNSTMSEVLSNTNFNLHFEPPEGVSEDELNSTEKIYYSFQKRTFIGYVNSFYSTYQSIVLKRPTLLSILRSERHLMTGKVIFDIEGNIMRIQILRSSSNDDLHELFETTLRNIRSLPNPPKDLVKGREEFTIYYQLRIN